MTPTEIKLKQRPRRERIRQAQRVGLQNIRLAESLKGFAVLPHRAQDVDDRANAWLCTLIWVHFEPAFNAGAVGYCWPHGLGSVRYASVKADSKSSWPPPNAVWG